MNLTKDQISLLLYLECRATDDSGTVRSVQMNKADFDNAEQWNKDGFIRFGRLPVARTQHGNTHWVVLSEAAFEEAYRLRRERATRGLSRLKKRLQPYADKPVVAALFEPKIGPEVKAIALPNAKALIESGQRVMRQRREAEGNSAVARLLDAQKPESGIKQGPPIPGMLEKKGSPE
jgi:hypothetical protein